MPAVFKLTNPGAIPMTAEQAVSTICFEIEAEAKQLCPVDTGTLRRSITTTAPVVSGGGVTGSVETGIHYAPYVEFGTRKMAAQPFLGPALESARARWA